MSKAFKCHDCNKPVRIAAFITNCEVAWVMQNWVSYNCPNCNKNYLVQVHNDFIQFGKIDGGPGSCFITESTQRIPGLRLEKKNKFIELFFEEFSKRIPQK